MKYEKCIVSVLYFVVCFVKTLVKYPRNVKYDKCIVDLRAKARTISVTKQIVKTPIQMVWTTTGTVKIVRFHCTDTQKDDIG